jgi:hypothetical protein
MGLVGAVIAGPRIGRFRIVDNKRISTPIPPFNPASIARAHRPVSRVRSDGERERRWWAA